MGFCDYQSESTFHRDRPEDVFYVAPTKLALHFHGVCVNVSVNVLLGMGLAAALANVPRWSGGEGERGFFWLGPAPILQNPPLFLGTRLKQKVCKGARQQSTQPHH